MKAMNSLPRFAEQATQDRERQHYAQNRRIADLWEDDRRKLLTLPEQGFEAFRLANVLGVSSF